MDILNLSSVTLVTSLASLGLALFFLVQHFKENTNRILFSLFSSFFVQQWGLWQLWKAGEDAQAMFWAKIAQLGICLAPFFFLIMVLHWRTQEPLTMPMRTQRLIYLYCSIPLLLCLSLFLPSFVSGVEGLRPPMNIRYGPMGYAFFIYYLVTILLASATIENILKEPSAQMARFRYPLALLLGWFIMQLLLIHSQILIDGSVLPGIFLSSSPILLIIEIFFTYFVLRHGLVEINLSFSQELTIRSATGAIVIIYLAIVVVSFRMGISLLSLPLLLAVLFSITTLVILLFAHPRWRAQLNEFILLHLYKSKYDFRSKIGDLLRLAAEDDLETLISRILDFCLKSTDSTGGIIYLSNGDGAIMCSTGWDESGRAELLTKEDNPEKLGQELGLACLIPLKASEDSHGFLGLKEKSSGKGYDRDDRYFLNLICLIAGYLISHKKQAKQSLAYKEWEVINQLSTFIIHDLKNTTSFLSLSLENAPKHLDNPEFRQEFLNNLDQSLREMKGLIEKLSSVRQRKRLEKERLDLNKFLEEEVARMKMGLGKDVEFILDLNPLPPLSIDRERMSKVLDNICLNAAEAMDGKGTIHLKTECMGQKAILEIRDDGCGMEEEFIKNRLFRPFQSTKPRGLGIGLYQSKQIIEDHGGRIGVVSQPGKGSTFTIELPV